MIDIIDICTIFDDTLFAIKWKGSYQNCFDEIQTKVSDAEWCFNFFEKHRVNLFSGYYEYSSIEEAYKALSSEFYVLNSKIVEICGLGSSERHNHLSTLFKPLSNNYYRLDYRESKAMIDGQKAMLRIYAIRLSMTTFIVTGWGIKLVKTMQDDEELENELEKFKIVEAFLKREGIYL